MTGRIDVHHYFAQFRDAREADREAVITEAARPARSTTSSACHRRPRLAPVSLRVAISDAFAGWDTDLQDGDAVAFMTPTAGG
ncbi:MAG: MoaD/ThiS family protein [Rubricoccaceae bacterium]